MASEALVVADSGPLIALAVVGKLDLLHKLYSRVIVPGAVWKEVVIDSSLPGASEILAAT